MKKQVYLAQVGFPFDESVYLPYAVGVLAAAAWADGYVKENYELADILFLREDIAEVADRIENPFLVGFSNYVWNFEYNKKLAQEIKKRFPECIILFGGHNAERELLCEAEYVDVIIEGEGEIPFTELLKNDGEFSKAPCCVYRDESGKIVSSYTIDSPELDSLPSPYLTGIFDKIMEENPELDFLSVIETNRGCPHSCSYCDWCAGKKLRVFPMEKVLAELRWLSDKKISYCFCADSNFGLLQRDVDIVKELVKIKQETGYPEVFRPCYAKNNEERVFEICTLLNSCKMDKGATFAFQTLNNEALENINRKNLNLEHFSGLMKRYNREKIPSYSELILGLPGETYDSFCDGMCALLEAGQHRSLSVYHCELLRNSEMGTQEYIKKYGIETVRVEFNHMHSSPEKKSSIKEYSNLVVATNTMSREMWVKANLFSVCVQCFHNLGLLQCFALYLYFAKGVSYRSFYQRLLDEIMSRPDTAAGKVFASIEKKLRDELSGEWNYINPLFGNVTFLFEEGAFLELLYRHSDFEKEIEGFLKSFDIDKEIFDDLFGYQRAILKKPGKAPFDYSFRYDWTDYFEKAYEGVADKPEERRGTISVLCDNTNMKWDEYAKYTVWYGRRRGAVLCTNDKSEYSVSYEEGQNS